MTPVDDSLTFTRRTVDRALLAVAIALLAPGRAPPAGRTKVLDFAVAGGWYHGLDQARPDMATGDLLRLVAEPDNPHDANAVAVWRGDLMLGYMPRAANEFIARLLASGARIEAEVSRIYEWRSGDGAPEDFAYTSVASGDPVIRATLVAG